MKRSLAMLIVPLAMSACQHPVSEAEFEALRVRADSLEVRLNRVKDWAVAMRAWGATTGDVICDVAAKNPPTSPYAPETQNYCGPGDPDPSDPPPPPEWGG